MGRHFGILGRGAICGGCGWVALMVECALISESVACVFSRTCHEQMIERMDGKIESLVYALYELRENEVAVVEGG